MIILLQYLLCKPLERSKEYHLLHQLHIDSFLSTCSVVIYLHSTNVFFMYIYFETCISSKLSNTLLIRSCHFCFILFQTLTCLFYDGDICLVIKHFITDVATCLKSHKWIKPRMDSKQKETRKVQRTKPHVQHLL